MINQAEIKTIQLYPEQAGGRKNEWYAAQSVQGARDAQQDSIFVGEKDNSFLAAICDGMGGMNGGEQASALAIQILAEAFYSRSIQDEAAFLRTMAYRMDEAVYRLERNGKRLRAGTTVVAVIITSRRMYWLSVGDSKLYLYRDGQILCPVAAHNYRLILDRQLAAGTIDREKYQEEEKRGEALISYIGIGGLTRIETNKQPFLLEPGDQVLLCSDGLYRSVSEDRIREVLGRTMLPDEKLSQLIGEALSNGGNGQDNTSAILIRG